MNLRKIYILILLSVFGSKVQSQNYIFTEFATTYQHLVAPNSINGGAVWDDETVAIPIGFDFDIYGKTYSTLYLSLNGAIYFDNPTTLNIGDTIALIQMFEYDFVDLGFGSGVSQSPLSFQLDSSIPDEGILKIEFRNVGHKLDGSNTSYMNLQLWLYEENGRIELRFGENNDPNLIGYIGVGQIILDGSLTTVQGNFIVNNPSLITMDFTYLNNFFSGVPLDGRIYRLEYSVEALINLNSSAIIPSSAIYDGILNSFGGIHGRLDESIGGALVGNNKFYDKEFGQSFHLKSPILMKGVLMQNYGVLASNDSCSINLYDIDSNGMPDSLLYSKKVAYHCLSLDGSINYIAFDSAILISDTFYLTMELADYHKNITDQIGLYMADSPVLNLYLDKRVIRMFDGNWYQIYDQTFVDRYDVTIAAELGATNYGIAYFGLTPLFNQDVDETAIGPDSLQCTPYVGINPYSNEQEIVVFPNPANDYVHIQLPQMGVNTTLKIIDTKGDLVYTSEKINGQEIRIEIDHLASGLYTLLIITEDNLYSKQIVKW